MPIRKHDQVLAQLLSEPIIAAIEEAAAAADAPPGEPQPAVRPIPRPSVPPGPAPLPPPSAVRGIYRRIGTTLALLGAGVVAGLIWYFSGIFTLDYLSDTFRQLAPIIAQSPWWQIWLIPLSISAMELFLWPHRERRLGIFSIRLILWGAMLAFDVLTTYRGMLPIIREQDLPFVLPADWRWWLDHGTSLLIGAAFAYLPERTIRWVLADLWALWGAPLWRRIHRWLDNSGSGS